MQKSKIHQTTPSRWLENLRWLGAALANGEPSSILKEGLLGKCRPIKEESKRATLRHYCRKHGLKTFIETGTFRGDTLEFLQEELESLYSIELSSQLHSAALERFRGNPKVHLLQGDSGDVLRQLIPKIASPALIWLDAHYSAKVTAHGAKETPVIDELDCIFGLSRAKHIILIDDVRDFLHNPNYPTLEEVREKAIANGYAYESRFELIRLMPC